MKLRYAIWERLKKAKEEQGLTYRELSKRTGISQTALTTLFSAKPNCTVGRLITISKALNRDLSYAFGEQIGKILIYPETEREAINNFWKQIDSYYLNPKGRKHYSRKKVYQSMGKAYYRAVGEDNIHLSLDVVEKFSMSNIQDYFGEREWFLVDFFDYQGNHKMVQEVKNMNKE